MMRAIIRRQESHSIFIHNDLDSAAHYFAQIIRTKLEAGERGGIAFDCIACATMIAFSFEAYLNFFGHKLVPEWQERQRTDDKIKQVLAKLNITPDWSRRPYSGVRAMKALRDTFAHGKPVQFELDVEEEALIGELDGKRASFSADWEKQAQPELVQQAYEDLTTLWKEMLEASGLELFEAMTHGFHGISLVRMVNDATGS